MDSIVEENGNSSNNIDDRTRDIMQQQQQQHQQPQQQQQQQQHHQPQVIAVQQQNTNSAGGGSPLPPNMPQSATASVLTSTANVVQYLPSATHGLQQSVIQANQSSVIQSAVTNSLPKGAASSGVLYMSKPAATVIHTTSGNAVQIKPEPPAQQLDSNSDDSYTDEDSPRRQKDLTRRPSYHKIFNEISGPNISVGTNMHMAESGSVPAITNTSSGGGGNAGGALIHMPQDSATAFYLPNRIPYNTNNSVIAEDQTRKREIRLQKNREAARECRRKKKEYIKCLENRVAVLENQNKALIEELKSFKELYCQTKND